MRGLVERSRTICAACWPSPTLTDQGSIRLGALLVLLVRQSTNAFHDLEDFVSVAAGHAVQQVGDVLGLSGQARAGFHHKLIDAAFEDRCQSAEPHEAGGRFAPLIPGITFGAHVDQVCHRLLSQARLLAFPGNAAAYDLVQLDLATHVRGLWIGRASIPRRRNEKAPRRVLPVRPQGLPASSSVLMSAWT